MKHILQYKYKKLKRLQQNRTPGYESIAKESNSNYNITQFARLDHQLQNLNNDLDF